MLSPKYLFATIFGIRYYVSPKISICDYIWAPILRIPQNIYLRLYLGSDTSYPPKYLFATIFGTRYFVSPKISITEKDHLYNLLLYKILFYQLTIELLKQNQEQNLFCFLPYGLFLLYLQYYQA